MNFKRLLTQLQPCSAPRTTAIQCGSSTTDLTYMHIYIYFFFFLQTIYRADFSSSLILIRIYVQKEDHSSSIKPLEPPELGRPGALRSGSSMQIPH